jgi:hypothetical protein
MYHYHKLVNDSNDDNNEIYSYLPAYTQVCYKGNKNKFPWSKLEADITYYSVMSDFNFISDKTFMSATYPLDRPINYLNNRYLFDIRYLRVDNSYNTNTREIYIPYYVNSTLFKTRDYINSILLRRDSFIFAPCREAYGKMDKRDWRIKAYNALVNITINSTITIDERVLRCCCCCCYFYCLAIITIIL